MGRTFRDENPRRGSTDWRSQSGPEERRAGFIQSAGQAGPFLAPVHIALPGQAWITRVTVRGVRVFYPVVVEP